MATLSKRFIPQYQEEHHIGSEGVWMNKNAGGSRSLCPDSLFERPHPAQNGEPYPPRTMHKIHAGLQRQMLEFLDTNNTAFREPVTLSTNSCIGKTVKHCYVHCWRKKWSTGTISILTPKSLQRAVLGKHFCIRGGEEQRSLGHSHFVRSENPECYTYIGHRLLCACMSVCQTSSTRQFRRCLKTRWLMTKLYEVVTCGHAENDWGKLSVPISTSSSSRCVGRKFGDLTNCTIGHITSTSVLHLISLSDYFDFMHYSGV